MKNFSLWKTEKHENEVSFLSHMSFVSIPTLTS